MCAQWHGQSTKKTKIRHVDADALYCYCQKSLSVGLGIDGDKDRAAAATVSEFSCGQLWQHILSIMCSKLFVASDVKILRTMSKSWLFTQVEFQATRRIINAAVLLGGPISLFLQGNSSVIVMHEKCHSARDDFWMGMQGDVQSLQFVVK